MKCIENLSALGLGREQVLFELVLELNLKAKDTRIADSLKLWMNTRMILYTYAKFRLCLNRVGGKVNRNLLYNLLNIVGKFNFDLTNVFYV